MNRAWVVACAAAEAIGITAASGAARCAMALEDRGAAHAAAWGLAIVVAGGLVEGTALGWLQARSLARVLGPIGRRRWLVATVVVAGLGWAAASAPAVLAGDDDGAQPPLVLVLLGAVGLGATMGAVLGAAQGWALRHRVRHPWRWVIGSATGWAVAMPVVFLGASVVPGSWAWWLVVPVGTVTGAVAGSVLGVASGPFLGTLDGPAWHHRLVLRILSSRLARTPAGAADGGLVALRVTGRRTGRAYRFPVEAAWWHSDEARPEVEVLLAAEWIPARAILLRPGDAVRPAALDAYAARFPSARASADPLVVLELASKGRRAGRSSSVRGSSAGTA
jgi:hypothetical protein